ncbi:unnamed protein product [Adineta ricciae]|uniref:Uncharacterized protein n=1 Tax=Adineta ricciae TaxID=249248 RepID=A0A815H1L9_ADIRI|nr:unnamed protein product [Adineta ricciae]
MSYKRLLDFIKKLNVYDEDETLSHFDQILSTRIFLSLMIIIFTIIIISTSLSFQPYHKTVLFPSENTFKNLSIRYPTTRSCLCRQSSIRQDKFTSFNPRFHPICTSQFIDPTFLQSLFDKNVSDYWPFDYRKMVAAHFQLITLYCRHMKQKTFDVIKEFSSKYLITAEALTNDVFNTQAKELIDHFISVTVAKNMYINEFIEFSISKNSIHTGLRSNYLMKIFPSRVSSGPVTYQTTDDMCKCSADDVCSSPAGIYNITERTKIMNGNIFHINQSDTPLIFQLPNIKVGSYPYSSLHSSTLECFYNQSCIDLLRSYIPGFSFVSPLISSDFPPETFVKSLINKLFVESWNEVINFSSYYQICSPHSCVYSYNRRFNFLYTLTVVLGLFGGLKMILLISIPYFIQSIRRIKIMIYQRWKRRKTTTVIQSNEVQSNLFFLLLFFRHDLLHSVIHIIP